MNELSFWTRHVKPALNSRHHDRVAWKVGTSTRAGIPDVAYRSGPYFAWIELKQLDDWPVRVSTPLRPGTTPEQRAHLRDWCYEGRGSGYVLLAVARDVILFPWWTPEPIDRDQIDDLVLGRLALKDVKRDLGRLIDHHLIPPDDPTRPVVEAAWLELSGTS